MFYLKNCEIYWITVMASPGQRRGSCGHIIAGFDAHDKCARCCDKGLGTDPCIVGGAICTICDGFTPAQLDMLTTPQYQIRKDKKEGLLISLKDAPILGSTGDLAEEVHLEALVLVTRSSFQNMTLINAVLN